MGFSFDCTDLTFPDDEKRVGIRKYANYDLIRIINGRPPGPLEYSFVNKGICIVLRLES